jgi:hypothetical protein
VRGKADPPFAQDRVIIGRKGGSSIPGKGSRQESAYSGRRLLLELQTRPYQALQAWQPRPYQASRQGKEGAISGIEFVRGKADPPLPGAAGMVGPAKILGAVSGLCYNK